MLFRNAFSAAKRFSTTSKMTTRCFSSQITSPSSCKGFLMNNSAKINSRSKFETSTECAVITTCITRISTEKSELNVYDPFDDDGC